MAELDNTFQRSGVPLEIGELWQGNDFFFGSTQIPGTTRLAFNTRCTEGNCFDRRRGYVVWGGGGDAGQVYASMVLQQGTSADIFLRLVDGAGAGVQLQKYDAVNDEWDDIGTNIGTADDRTDFSWTYVQIAGEDRVYFTNGVSDLLYTNGTAVTTVPGIKGKFITSMGNILLMGHMTATYTSNTFVYSSAGTHNFYLDDGIEDYLTTSQKVTVDGIITGIKSFNWMVYVFTESDGMFEVDARSGYVNDFRQITTHGTMCPKSIAVGADSMFWADQYGVWQLPIGGSVQKISKSVDKIFQCVTGANFYQLTGGVNNKEQYELHLGDLTFEGTAYKKVALVYEIEQSRFYERNIWRVDTDKVFANNIVTWANEYGFPITFYGDRYTQTTYQTDYGYADITDEITMTWQSKDFVLANDKQEITLEDIYIRYEPLGADDIPITVYARMDTGAWVTVKTQDLPVSAKSHYTVRMQAPMGLTGRSVAIKIVSTSSLPLKIRNILVTHSYNSSERRL